MRRALEHLGRLDSSYQVWADRVRFLRVEVIYLRQKMEGTHY